MHASVRTRQFCKFHIIGITIFCWDLEPFLQRLQNPYLFAHVANTSDQCKRLCMVAELVLCSTKTHSPPVVMAATQMPLPGDYVTNERLETILFGIATQIARGMSEVKSEMTALVNEAELHWQARPAMQRENQGTAGTPLDFACLGEERAQSQAAVDGKLLAQDAELQQLQQGFTDVGA